MQGQRCLVTVSFLAINSSDQAFTMQCVGHDGKYDLLCGAFWEDYLRGHIIFTELFIYSILKETMFTKRLWICLQCPKLDRYAQSPI